MSERLVITLACCATAVLIAVSTCLTLIALTHDGTNESLIVTALLGIPTFIITMGGPLLGHWLGAQAALKDPNKSPTSN